MTRIQRGQSHPGRLSGIAHCISHIFHGIFRGAGTKILIKRNDNAFQNPEVKLEFHNWIGEPEVTATGRGSVQLSAEDQTKAITCALGAFKHAVLAVGCTEGDEDDLIKGSAFMIGPGVAITASHVIRNVKKDELILTSISEREGLFWKCEDVSTLDDEHDIALLSLTLASEVPTSARVYKFGVSEKPPEYGETLKLFGYRQTKLSYKSDPGVVTEVTLDSLFCEGVITDVHFDHKTPRVQVNCGALGGMSGGIALNSEGLACGVISSGFNMEDGSVGPTFVALLHPVFELPFNMRRTLTQVECTTLAKEVKRTDENPAICFGPEVS